MKVDRYKHTDDDRKGGKNLTRESLGHSQDWRASTEAEDKAGRRPESNPAA